MPGIDIRETTGATTVTITGAEFRREAVYAIGFGDNVTVKLRNTIIELPKNDSNECVNSGIYFGGTGGLDLDATADNGNNQFVLAPTGTCHALYNVRSAAATPVTMKATTFTNTAPPLIPAAGCSATTNDRKWFIASPGTCPSTGNVMRSF